MKTVKLKSLTQNPDNPQKYGDDDIDALAPFANVGVRASLHHPPANEV
jgi:hypothetical protein